MPSTVSLAEIMKFLVVLICLCLVPTYTADDSSAPVSSDIAVATTSFSVDLLKVLLTENTGNMVVSGVILSILLAIVQQGAEGNTQAQLTKVLHAGPSETKKGYSRLARNLRVQSRNETLEFADGAFLEEGYRVKESFESILVNDFLSDIETVQFANAVEAADQINTWVSNHTHGRIQDLITPDMLDSNTRLVLTNAIYYKDVWETAFKENDTEDGSFYVTPTQTVTVPIMHLRETCFRIGYLEELDAQWVALPFQGGRFSLLVIVPNEKDGINTLVNRISALRLYEIIYSLNATAATKINLSLPKFKLQSDLKLIPALEELGLEDIFTSQAQLQGISDERLRVSEVVQKAEIEVNEQGATASAGTGAEFMTLSFQILPDITVDHPFLAFVVDEINNIPLFAARVADPSQL